MPVENDHQERQTRGCRPSCRPGGRPAWARARLRGRPPAGAGSGGRGVCRDPLPCRLSAAGRPRLSRGTARGLPRPGCPVCPAGRFPRGWMRPWLTPGRRGLHLAFRQRSRTPGCHGALTAAERRRATPERRSRTRMLRLQRRGGACRPPAAGRHLLKERRLRSPTRRLLTLDLPLTGRPMPPRRPRARSVAANAVRYR